MPKIKIDKLPEGFIIRDGKVVKGMVHGGSTGVNTGDQYDYRLVTTPTKLIGDQVNTDDDRKVRHTLASVPREDANLEAEGGETVLTDLNNDGQFGLYTISGPSHDDGGVPMRLPDQSFIFSRDEAMAIDSDTLKDAFGIRSSKAMTPAQVSKKFELNDYNVQLASPNSDYISRETAELMLTKNKMDLSKLAFTQESLKRFVDGVPLAAFPYIQSQGVNPIQFKQKIEDISQQEAQQAALNQLPPQERQRLMQQAEFMTRMQQAEQQRQAQMQMEAGIERNVLTQPEGVESPENAPRQMQYGGTSSDSGGISSSNPQLTFAYNEQLPDGRIDEPFLQQRMRELYAQMPPREEAMSMMQVGGEIDSDFPTQTGSSRTSTASEEPIISDRNFEALAKRASGGSEAKEKAILAFLQNAINTEQIEAFLNTNPSDDELTSYLELAVSNDQGQPVVEEGEATEVTTEAADGEVATDSEELSGYDKLEKLFRSDSPEWLQITDDLYAAFKANMIASGISEADIPEKDAMIDLVLDEQKAQKRLTELAPFDEIHDNARFDGPSNMDNVEAQKLFDKYDLGYTIDELNTKLIQGFFEAVDFYASDYVNVTGTGPDEPENYEDNPTLSSIDGVAGDNYINTTLDVVKLPEVPEEEPEEEPEMEPADVPDIVETREQPDPEFWKQDLLRLQSIAGRRRRLGLPFEPAVEQDTYRYVLNDPTREIAALNEVKNITDQSIASFAPAQSFLARTAKTTGDTMARIADTVSKYQTSNVDLVNRGAYINAQLTAANRKESRNRAKTLYDNTEAALAQYLKEQNFDREQYISAYSDAITNMANTYNLNSLYDIYNIDPSSGGFIDFVDGIDLNAKNSSDAVQSQRADIRSAIAELYNSVPEGASIPASVINAYIGVQDAESDELTNLERAREQYLADPSLNYQGSNVQRRMGGSMPFYTGLTGV